MIKKADKTQKTFKEIREGQIKQIQHLILTLKLEKNKLIIASIFLIPSIFLQIEISTDPTLHTNEMFPAFALLFSFSISMIVLGLNLVINAATSTIVDTQEYNRLIEAKLREHSDKLSLILEKLENSKKI